MAVLVTFGFGLLLGVAACTKDSTVRVPQNDKEPTEDENDVDGDGVEGNSTMPVPGADTPIPSKIRYVIVLVKENHTFDNYFTGFPGAESSATAKTSDNKTVKRAVAPSNVLPKDPCHANSCGVTAYAHGAMNGFDLTGAGDVPFFRYTESQIPNYWQYARNFVLADHMFSTTLGPSAPGHEVFWVGRSLSLDNAKCHKDGGVGCTGAGCTADDETTITAYDPGTCSTKTVKPCFDVPALPDHLPKDFTWTDYGGAMALYVKSVVAQPDYKTHFRKASDLVSDLGAGKLSNLTIAHLSSGSISEHPPQYPCNGENFTVDVVNAAMKLPQWKEMAIVITWDDWGGFYDHVKPAVRSCANGKILQTGFRLPLILVSPYAKKGFVLKTPAEQASVPRLVEDLWGMPYMSTRDKHAGDGAAGSLMGAFDFDQTPRDPMILEKKVCPAAPPP